MLFFINVLNSLVLYFILNLVKELLNLILDVVVILLSLLLFLFSAPGSLLFTLLRSLSCICLSFRISFGCILNGFLLLLFELLFLDASSLLFELCSQFFSDKLTDELLATLAVLLLLGLVHIPFVDFNALVLGVNLVLGKSLLDECRVEFVLHAQGRHIIVF